MKYHYERKHTYTTTNKSLNLNQFDFNSLLLTLKAIYQQPNKILVYRIHTNEAFRYCVYIYSTDRPLIELTST